MVNLNSIGSVDIIYNNPLSLTRERVRVWSLS